MAHWLHQFLFGILPYIALSVLAIGSIVRYEREPYSWRTGSSQLLRRKQLMWGSNLFHVGILVIFLGHLGGLLTPIAVFDALGVPHGAKQLMAMVAGGIAGVICFIGATILLHRRLFDARIRSTSAPADIFILVLLYLQVVMGLLTIPLSAGHMDGHEMMKFMTWAQGIFTFQGDAAAAIADVHWMFKAHILNGLLIFIAFPFSRLVHFLSAPIRYTWRTGYQIVRTRRRPAE